MTHALSKCRRNRGGFTIPELLCASMVMAMVTAGTMSFFVFFLRGWQSTAMVMVASDDASKALQRMVHSNDGRGGLMGADRDSSSLENLEGGSWRIEYGGGRLFSYDAANSRIVNEGGRVICDNVVTSSASLGPFGVQLAVSVEDETRGRRHISSMSTYVDFRN